VTRKRSPKGQPRIDVPKADSLVGTGGGEGSSIGTKRQAIDFAGVESKRTFQGLTGCDIPVKWFNDFELATLNGLPLRPTTLEAQNEWYARVVKSASSVIFTIYERATRLPIGGTSLSHIDDVNRTAEFTILIGEKDCWGKGYGTETTRLMLDYAFTALGLHNVYLRVFSYNERAIRAYTRAGFKPIGRQREARRVGNRAFDVIYMDCLATEFASPVLKNLLP
jgi:RimJ/RimL family protein N-acetyltransferase